MDIRARCAQLDASLLALIEHAALEEQPDTRAFGSSVKRTIKDNWSVLCCEWGVEPETHPGARSIFDVSFRTDNLQIGVDIKSKNLGSGRLASGQP